MPGLRPVYLVHAELVMHLLVLASWRHGLVLGEMIYHSTNPLFIRYKSGFFRIFSSAQLCKLRSFMSDASVLIPIPLTHRAALLLLQKSQAKNCSPSQLIEEEFSVVEAEEVNSKSDIYSKPLEEAVERAKRIPPGNEFTLARLYLNDWELVPNPTAFGRLFKEALEQQGIARHTGRDNTVKMAKYLRN